ncbi:MAG TPA: EF-P lysine aminoacylase EpmA [Steroidobacteraceae bacterium]|nr:EF-P lysine aminoacylase EpmA [Steroidobacteraceae bacterium]
MPPLPPDWHPTISIENLRLRAALLAQTRRFFAARHVLEVDTPLVVNAPVSDVHIASAGVELAGAGRAFLHTSPEYAMKRLLAAGSGDIYQICHVVRGDERGRLHNPEFTLIEWYRLGFSIDALMDEVEALVRELLGAKSAALRSERIAWRTAFMWHAALDPVEASRSALERAATDCALAPDAAAAADRDSLLDLVMSVRVGPLLGRGALTFVHRYPASQAALARLDPPDPRFALRFELYCEGIELANGFAELGSSAEQRARFELDLAERARRALPLAPLDERLLGALSAGLPDCAGVAVGFDRVLMLAAGASHIEAVLPFTTDRA